jgi:hypothetical protein
MKNEAVMRIVCCMDSYIVSVFDMVSFIFWYFYC